MFNTQIWQYRMSSREKKYISLAPKAALIKTLFQKFKFTNIKIIGNGVHIKIP